MAVSCGLKSLSPLLKLFSPTIVPPSAVNFSRKNFARPTL